MKVLALVLLFAFPSVLAWGLMPQPEKHAYFQIASWSYPDEYGQGIEAIRAYQYQGAAWVAIDGGFDVGNTESTTFDIEAGGAINITVKCWLNNSIVGAADIDAAKNYLSHSVIVSTPLNASVFSQVNFTYLADSDALDPLFYYQYQVTLAFSPEEATTYTAVIDQDVAQGEFLYGWTKKKYYSLTSIVDLGTNYQFEINVTYDSDMQADFDDLRFAAADGTTILSAWLESKVNSAWANVWINPTDDFDIGNHNTWMYYGNPAASNYWNGHDTFIFYDGFETNDFSYWDTHEAQWSVQSGTVKYGTYAAYCDSAATNRNLQTAIGTLTSGFMVHSWARFQSTAGTEYPIISYDDKSTLQYGMYSPANEFSTYDGSSTLDYFTNGQVGTTWQELEVAYDFTNGLFRPWIDGVHKTDRPLKDSSTVTITNVTSVASVGSNTINQDHWIDDFYIRKWNVNEPSVFYVSAESAFTGTAATWIEATTIDIILVAPISQETLWALNNFYIIGGMVLVIASGVYLVKGGKDEMSTDKLLFFLMAFMVGWGLIIGGVMP